MQALDESELKLAKYIVTGLTLAVLGFSSCATVGYVSDIAVQRERSAAPGYTGCDHHCGNAVLELEKAQ